jgi:hypothetical protein
MAAMVLGSLVILPQAGWQATKLFVWLKNGRPDEFGSEKQMVAYLREITPPLIISDVMLSRHYGIYDGFRQPMPFRDYLHTPYDSLSAGTYLLLNKNREKSNLVNRVEAATFTRSQNVIPGYVHEPEKHGFILEKENEADKLYRLAEKNP